MALMSEKPILLIHCQLESILKFGVTPYGERRIINILGGTVEGPKLKGRILPGGADWQIVREDGTAELVARYTLQATDGKGGQHRGPDLCFDGGGLRLLNRL